MDQVSYSEYGWQVRQQLHALILRRYGREGDILQRGYRLSLLEAAYSITGGWWSLQQALAAAGTAFQTYETKTRLELLMRDLVLHPDDGAAPEWARLYGYSTPSAAARAFRNRFGVRVTHARRMGRLGIWLGTAKRTVHSDEGQRRVEEAYARIEAFTRLVSWTTAGTVAGAALARLGDVAPPEAIRPRYPALGQSEAQLLHPTDR